jgi:hypothetical protein
MIAHGFMTRSDAEAAQLLVVEDDSAPWQRSVLGPE